MGNPGGSRQSAEFTFRCVPPRICFMLFDHDIRKSWQITNTRFNMQARDSLRTLRNVEAWVSNAGFDAYGIFRAIMPCTATITLPLVMRLNVEISWDTAFVNITTQIGEDWLLWSTRTTRWDEVNCSPPDIVYLQPPNQGPTIPAVVITDVTANHEQSSSSSTLPPLILDNQPIVISEEDRRLINQMIRPNVG